MSTLVSEQDERLQYREETDERGPGQGRHGYGTCTLLRLGAAGTKSLIRSLPISLLGSIDTIVI